MKEIENKKVKIEEENDVIDFQMEFLHTKKKINKLFTASECKIRFCFEKNLGEKTDSYKTKIDRMD